MSKVLEFAESSELCFWWKEVHVCVKMQEIVWNQLCPSEMCLEVEGNWGLHKAEKRQSEWKRKQRKRWSSPKGDQRNL